MSVAARSGSDVSTLGPRLLGWLAVALMLRLLVAGRAGAASESGTALFGMLLLAGGALGGWRPRRLRAANVGWGVVAAVGLVVGPLLANMAGTHPTVTPPAAAFPLWAVVVSCVGLGEEVLVRGALFGAIEAGFGTRTALGVTTVAFALVHVPLYGVGALPLDLAVGLWLGGLRVVTGGVTAPATAHVLADLAAWWL